MISGSGHDHTLDWWALGILTYEMIIGIPPFYNQNKHQMYFLIQNAPIRWPSLEKHGIGVSPEARDLIDKMLQKDRKNRLGLHNDIEDIVGHPWFKDLDINKLLDKKIQAPYIPKITADSDLQNFDAEVRKQAIDESIVPEGKKVLITNKDELFSGFGPMLGDGKSKSKKK